MNTYASKVALWLTQRVLTNESLVGDVLEQSRQGRSTAWLWKQLLTGLAFEVAGRLRRRWPEATYAFAGASIAPFAWRPLIDVRGRTGWASLDWPWSFIVFEYTPHILLAVSALPVLAVGLRISGRLTLLNLLRTLVLSIGAFATLRAITPGATPPRTYWFNSQCWTLPELAVGSVMFVCVFLVSAWLGCLRLPKRTPALPITTN